MAAQTALTASEIVSGIREVERLVAEREVRDDVVQHRVLERGPVPERGVDHLHARERVRSRREHPVPDRAAPALDKAGRDRKSTRLNSSHLVISYAVFCLKKKTTNSHGTQDYSPAAPCPRQSAEPRTC